MKVGYAAKNRAIGFKGGLGGMLLPWYRIDTCPWTERTPIAILLRPRMVEGIILLSEWGVPAFAHIFADVREDTGWA